jgi:hypothetical protein
MPILSAPVTDGMPTAYSHYNNLRLDALTLSAAEADGVNLAAALSRYQDNLKLEPLATNRLRLPYDVLRPPTLMIDGALCQATAHVDTNVGTFSGAAGTWYLFATRTPGATTFTLTANSSSAEWLRARRIGEIYWTGAALNYDSLRVYGPGRPGVYYARVSRAAAQSLANATPAAITFDTEDVDTDDMYSAGAATKISIVQPGLYLLAGTVGFAANATGARTANLLLGGTLIAGNDAVTHGAGSASYASVFALRYLQASEYVELQAMQTSGGSLNTATPTTLAVAALSA